MVVCSSKQINAKLFLFIYLFICWHLPIQLHLLTHSFPRSFLQVLHIWIYIMDRKDFKYLHLDSLPLESSLAATLKTLFCHVSGLLIEQNDWA